MTNFKEPWLAGDRLRGFTRSENAITNRDIVAIGTSAGGVEALKTFRQIYPRRSWSPCTCPARRVRHSTKFLSHAGPLPPAIAGDRQPLRKGRIFLALPGRHLLADGNHLNRCDSAAMSAMPTPPK
jgi:chemotaxis response regulator CheB